MARKIINVGSAPGAGDGECIRDAFNKINDNFDEVYALANQEDGHLTTDVTGSVFADDTSTMIDGVAGKVVGPVESPEVATPRIVTPVGMTPRLEILTDSLSVCVNGEEWDPVTRSCVDATTLEIDNSGGTGGLLRLGRLGGGGTLEIDNTDDGGTLTLEGGNDGGSLVIDDGNDGNGGSVTITGGGGTGGTVVVEGDNGSGGGSVILQGGNDGGTLIIEEGSSAGSGNVYLQSASCGSNGSIVIGGCDGVDGRIVLDSILDTLTLGDPGGINIDIDVSNRGITLGDTSSAGTSRINIDGDADRIRLGDLTGLVIDIDVNNDGINLGDLTGNFLTLDNAAGTTKLGTAGGSEIEIDDTAKTVTIGDPTGTKITTDGDNDIAEIVCWYPPDVAFPSGGYSTVFLADDSGTKIGDTRAGTANPSLTLDQTNKTTTLGNPTGSKIVTDDDNEIVAITCKDFPYEMVLDGGSGTVTLGDTSGTPTGPALVFDTTAGTTTLGNTASGSPQLQLGTDSASIGTTGNNITIDKSTNVISIGGPTINISIDASNTVTFNGSMDFSSATITNLNITDLTDVYSSMSPSDGQALIWDNGNTRWTSGTLSLPSLSDVYSSMSPNDGESLLWDDGNSRWTAGSLAITNLSDVYSSMSPNDGQVLTWDNSNSRWTATSISTVSLDDSGTLYLTSAFEGGEGYEGVSSIQWTSASELIFNISDGSVWNSRLDELTTNDSFELLTTTLDVAIDETVQVAGSVTSVVGGAGRIYTVPVDTAADVDKYIGTFNFNKAIATSGSIQDLDDVNSSMSPNNGDALIWDNGNTRWTSGQYNYYNLSNRPNYIRDFQDIEYFQTNETDGGILVLNASLQQFEIEHHTKVSINAAGALITIDRWGYGNSDAGVSDMRWNSNETITFLLLKTSEWVDRFNGVRIGDTIQLYNNYGTSGYIDVLVTGSLSKVDFANPEYWSCVIPINQANPGSPFDNYRPVYAFKLIRSFDTLRNGVISSNLYGDDSSLLYDAGTHEFHGTLRGDVIGSLFADDSTKILDAETGRLYADLVGSVFADDSSMVIDGESGQVVGDVAYTPNNNTFWNDPKPTTVKEAIERLAEALYVANGLNPF